MNPVYERTIGHTLCLAAGAVWLQYETWMTLAHIGAMSVAASLATHRRMNLYTFIYIRTV